MFATDARSRSVRGSAIPPGSPLFKATVYTQVEPRVG